MSSITYLSPFQFCNNQQDEKKETPRVQVIVGICAMEKKSLSKPMKEILSRIGEFEYLKTVIFPEDVIVNVSLLKELKRRDNLIQYFFFDISIQWNNGPSVTV